MAEQFNPLDPLGILGASQKSPLEALRRDIDRIKASVDTANLSIIAEVERAVASYGSALREAATKRVEKNLLTTTEHEVLRLAVEGLSNQEIAERLVITPETVRVHFLDIRRRIGVATREEAVAAFGKPTERGKMPTSLVRLPRVPREVAAAEVAAPFEVRIQKVRDGLDQLSKNPTMELASSMEAELKSIALEATEVSKSLTGKPRETLAIINLRATNALYDIPDLKSSIRAIQRETLPARQASARQALNESLGLIRESLQRPPD